MLGSTFRMTGTTGGATGTPATDGEAGDPPQPTDVSRIASTTNRDITVVLHSSRSAFCYESSRRRHVFDFDELGRVVGIELVGNKPCQEA